MAGCNPCRVQTGSLIPGPRQGYCRWWDGVTRGPTASSDLPPGPVAGSLSSRCLGCTRVCAAALQPPVPVAQPILHSMGWKTELPARLRPPLHDLTTAATRHPQGLHGNDTEPTLPSPSDQKPITGLEPRIRHGSGRYSWRPEVSRGRERTGAGFTDLAVSATELTSHSLLMRSREALYSLIERERQGYVRGFT